MLAPHLFHEPLCLIKVVQIQEIQEQIKYDYSLILYL